MSPQTLSDIGESVRTWYVLVTSSPQSYLWTVAVPGFMRKLAPFKKLRYIGPYIAYLLDSSWAKTAERYARVVLIAFVAITFWLSPFLVMSRQREETQKKITGLEGEIQDLKNKRDEIAKDLRSEIDVLTRRLDDRRLQQEKANEYAMLLDQGRKYLVRWMDGLRKNDARTISENRNLSFDWLKDVRAGLDRDFGRAVSTRFNLGKPADLIIGLSEPSEHEARLKELDTIIREMRTGTLHLSVGKR